MASSHTNESATQFKTCRCGEGDKNIWTTKTTESSDKQSQKCPNCQVFKSGPLFISSKGIGWTSWKKRWFVLTRTSLVFYRSDPNALPQKVGEANPTLGGIDLNNSGSVVVKADKKLLTVHFPDGRDGRTFTLKAETSEELHEWKTALENALAQAPSAALVMGQNGIFRNEIADSYEASFEQWRDRRPVKSLVVGRPILLALEDIDGSPSFLEKALRFIEEYGIKVEGILRQSADVEEVEHRVQEYEQGKNEFSSDEDAHVIADCIKHVLREFPSSPVPASCCTALVEAYRTGRGSRINAMRAAISETFPEPNRRLVQRILKMMRTVASHKSENRMTLSALAACMAPLLLRPLLAGDCEIEDDFNMGGDGSIQLLQAAAAANHAQAIVIILLEEYERIFDEELLQDDSLSSEIYTESEDDDVEDDESTDNDILEDDGYLDGQNDLEADREDDLECSSSGTYSGSSSNVGSDLYDDKAIEDHSTDSSSPKDTEVVEATGSPSSTLHTTTLQEDISQKPSSKTHIPFTQGTGVQKSVVLRDENSNSIVAPSHEAHESITDVHTSTSPMKKLVSHILPSSTAKITDKSNEPMPSIRRPTKWGRTSARKNLSMESIDYSSEDEIAIQRLETTKSDLQTKITKAVKGNAILQASLEKRKETLHERRLALEKDVERLREQLQKERDLRACLESGLNTRPGHLSITSAMDCKTREDLEEITLAEADIINLKQKVADLHGQLSHHLQHSYAPLCESCSQRLYKRRQSTEKDQQKNVDSTLPLLQHENSPKSDVGSSSVACENIQAQTQDLPSSLNKETSQKNPPETISRTTSSGSSGSSSTESSSSTGTMTVPNKIFTTDETSSRADHEDVKTRTRDSPSSPGQSPQKQQLCLTNQDSTMSLGSSSISYTEEPTTVVNDAASNNYSSRSENSMSAADRENVKTQTQDSLLSADRQRSKKLLRGEEAKAVVCDAASKKSTSKGENRKFGADSENVKAQTQDSLPSADMQPSQKLLPNTTKQSSTKSLESDNASSVEGTTTFSCNSASKRSSAKGENVKKEAQDSPSLPNRQPSQKQQPSTTNHNSVKPLGSSEGTKIVGRNAASKKSSRSEEVASPSSSALTRLTNRLNFLKERRVQLVNELKNLDTSCTSGPESLPRTDSK